MATRSVFLAATAVRLLIASVAGAVGIRKLRQVQSPTQTVESLEEDTRWARTRNS